MMKKHYRLFSGIFLSLLLIAWVVFLDTRHNDSVSGASLSEPSPTPMQVSATPTPAEVIASPTPAEVSASPTPTPAEVTPTPTQTPFIELATPTPEPVSPTPTPMPVVFNKAIANVEENLNIRSGPGLDYPIIAGMAPDTCGDVLEQNNEWIKIKSGDIVGYASAQYMLTGEAAIERAHQLNALNLKITSDNVNLYSGPSIDFEAVYTANTGDTFVYLPEYSNSEWCAVRYDSSTIAYLNASDAEIIISLGIAVPTE